MKNYILLILFISVNQIRLYASGPEQISGQILWKFQTNNVITSSPVYSDGIIYIGSGSSLLAVDTSGKEVFRFKTQGNIKCKAAIEDSVVYFQSTDGLLYCIDKKSGKEKWTFRLDTSNFLQLYDYWDYYQSSPLIVNNILYVGSTNTYLYAIDSRNGKEIWKFKTGHIIRSSPAYHNGNVYFGSYDGRFYALDAQNGSEIWNYRIEKPNYSRCGEIQSSAAFSGGKVIFGSRDGILHALDEITGKELWNYSHQGSWVISTPSVFENMVITGSSDAHFVNANDIHSGKELWRYNTQYNVFSSPLVYSGVVYCGDGNAYSFSEEASFFAIDALTGREIWKVKTGGQVWSSPVIAEGRIYFGAMDGCIYAIK